MVPTACRPLKIGLELKTCCWRSGTNSPMAVHIPKSNSIKPARLRRNGVVNWPSGSERLKQKNLNVTPPPAGAPAAICLRKTLTIPYGGAYRQTNKRKSLRVLCQLPCQENGVTLYGNLTAGSSSWVHPLPPLISRVLRKLPCWEMGPLCPGKM